MKFRLSSQPKQKEHKSIIPPHLLQDPAFSPDPHLNPYSTASQQLAWESPPLGHPRLKNKNRGPVLANFALHNGTLASADFDLQLLQPPNSPVSYSGGSGTASSFPFPPSLTLASSPHTPSSNSTPATAIAPLLVTSRDSVGASTVSNPSTVKKTRMTFLTRRKSLQTAPSLVSKSSSLPPDQNASRTIASRTQSESVLSAPRSRPALAPRATTSGASTPRSTATSTFSRRTGETRVNDLDRIDELDETSPMGLPLHHDGPYEVASQSLRQRQQQILDDIENTPSRPQVLLANGKPYTLPQAPMGVSLNLKPGQYLQRAFAEQRTNPPPPRMRDTSTLPPRMQQGYPVLHPSLSRSQSQLLPSQASSIPPRHLNRGDGRSDQKMDVLRRRQTQPPPSPALPNPHPAEPQSLIRPELFMPSQSQLSLDSFYAPNPQVSQFNPETSSLYQSSLDSRSGTASSSSISRGRSRTFPRTFIVSNPGPETSHVIVSPAQPPEKPVPNADVAEEMPEDAPFDIGMAMLHSTLEEQETPLIPTPRIFLPHGAADPEEEFNPYDPIHLENENSRTPSPLALTYDNSSQSSHAPSVREQIWEVTRQPMEVPKIAPERRNRNSELSNKQEKGPFSERHGVVAPPPYSFAVSESGKNILEDRKGAYRKSPHFHAAAEVHMSPSNVEQPPRPSIHSFPPSELRHTTPERLESSGIVAIQGVQQGPPQELYHPVQNVPNTNPAMSERPPVQVAPPNLTQPNQKPSPDIQQIIPMLPARRSRERLVPPPSTHSKYETERDARSTNQSFSTGSSGNPRNGAPPRRHVPVHLVMPTPLNTNNANATNPQAIPPHRTNPPAPPNHIPPRQIPPRRAQAAFQPHAQVYYPPPTVPSPLASNVYISQSTKELQEGAASRKLKKRTSILSPPSAVQNLSAPLITTVSFAPPVIGYTHPAPISKSVSRLKAEKIPKRVLSKRRTDL